MKKATKTAKPAASKALARVEPAAPAVQTLDVKLVHSEHWPAIQKYREVASKIVISDKASCAGALRTVEEGKELFRLCTATWKPIKQSIDKVKRAVLDLEQEETAQLDAGLGPLERRCVAWKKSDDERVEREAREQREADEKKKRAERDAELARQEEEAAALEADSPNLSPKELWFVEETYRREIDIASRATVDIKAMIAICKQAGYQDPEKWAAKLAGLPKIKEAIAIKREAAAKREQAAALREEPIIADAPAVESQVPKGGKTRFTKQYTLGAVEDLEKFIAAYRAGEIPAEAMVPNEVFLRREAKNLAEKFPQSFPGCTVKVLEGVAG